MPGSNFPASAAFAVNGKAFYRRFGRLRSHPARPERIRHRPLTVLSTTEPNDYFIRLRVRRLLVANDVSGVISSRDVILSSFSRVPLSENQCLSGFARRLFGQPALGNAVSFYLSRRTASTS
jgi:hypothetical protein